METSLLLANSSCTVRIAAAADRVDLPEWLFTLRDDEYRACSRAHIAGGASTTPDGRRMSINVEMPAETLLVQHYIEDLTTPDRCRVLSDTDGFTPLGPAGYKVVWEVSVAPDGDGACLFTNHVVVYATDALRDLYERHGVSIAQMSVAAQRTVDEHNAEETPLFARNIEAKARAGVWSRRDAA